MKKEKPGPQGLANLQTWRLPFSSDGSAVNASPKHRGEPMHEPVFFAHKVKRYRHRSLRHGKTRP